MCVCVCVCARAHACLVTFYTLSFLSGGTPIISSEKCLEEGDLFTAQACCHGLLPHDSSVWNAQVKTQPRNLHCDMSIFTHCVTPNHWSVKVAALTSSYDRWLKVRGDREVLWLSGKDKGLQIESFLVWIPFWAAALLPMYGWLSGKDMGL